MLKMYFFLDKSLTEIDFVNQVNLHDCLENLLTSAAEGCHVVYGDLGTLRFFRSNVDFNRRSKVLLDSLINSYHSKCGAYRQLDFCITVVKDSLSFVKNSPGKWTGPLSLCGDFSTVNKSLLLGENLIDSRLYKFAAKHYKIKSSNNVFRIALRPDGGGGATTVERLKQIVDGKESLCICVTDSDRLSPSGAVGSTSRRCAHIADSADWPVWYRKTNPRELENVLPSALINCALPPELSEVWKAVEARLSDMAPEANLYADLKEGVSLWWILSLPPLTPDRRWWDNAIAALKLPAQPTLCRAAGRCLEEKTKTDTLCDDCFVISGVSKKLADFAEEWLSKRSPAKIFQDVSLEISDEWLKIGKEVFSYCCAEDPIRV